MTEVSTTVNPPSIEKRKSVENLLLSSHDVIGGSISSLSFGTMTLPSSCPSSSVANSTGSLEPRSSSPSASPHSSPRPSPRQHHKRDHSVSSFKDSGLLDKPDAAEDNISLTSESSQVTELMRSSSHESTKDRKESRGSDRTKKKSAWYNALYPTYKSRSDDFRRIFKDVPPEERLVVDYSCALQKDILVHGRLYVSQNYLCFYANIFRWETSVSIKWKEVTAITKEKTALVIPNAILICTESEKLFFTSFGARDKTYLMLFRVWQNALMGQQMTMQEMWQWVHLCYGEELGLTSDDEDYVAPGSEEERLPNLGIRLSESFADDFPDATMDSLNNEDVNESGSLYSSGFPIPHSNIILNSRDDDQVRSLPLTDNLPTDMSDTTESDAEKPGKGERAVCTSAHEGRKIMRTIFPLHIDQVFTLLFTNSKFYLEFLTLRRSTDIKMSPWQENPETGLKQRVTNVTVALNQSVGPKSTRICETQYMLPCSKPGQLYAIDAETTNSGIPYADSFSVATHFCLTKTGENECCLAVYGQIKYKKTVWGIVKSFIEKNTWSGLDDFYTCLSKALKKEGDHDPIDEIINPGRRPRRRRRGMHLGPAAESSPSRPMIRLGDSDRRSISDPLSIGILGILIFLVCLNAVLYYKLWMLEEWSLKTSHPFTIMDLKVLRSPPKTHDEWLQLLQQQEALHNMEMQKWQKILQLAIQLLRQAEDSLGELQVSINPQVSKKIVSVLKDMFSSSNSNSNSREEDTTDGTDSPEGEL